jgi:hypothetical protein
MARSFNPDTHGRLQDELFAVVQPKSGSILSRARIFSSAVPSHRAAPVPLSSRRQAFPLIGYGSSRVHAPSPSH